MDPATAILNAITAILTLLRVLIEKAPPETAAKIIERHEARLDKFAAFLERRID